MNERSNLSNPKRVVWWPASVYLGLLVVGIPWYWPSDNHMVVFGMPAWVIIAIAASIVCSIFTASLLWSPWPSETNPSAKDQQDRSPDAD